MTIQQGAISLYTVNLGSVEHTSLCRAATKVQEIGTAVDAVAIALQAIQTIRELPVEDHTGVLAELTTEYVVGGLYAAISELGESVCHHGARMEELLRTGVRHEH